MDVWYNLSNKKTQMKTELFQTYSDFLDREDKDTNGMSPEFAAQFPDAKEIIRIDGLRVEYADGFGLARASNTTPVIVLRFEADDPAAMARIQNDFRHVLSSAKPGVTLPF